MSEARNVRRLLSRENNDWPARLIDIPRANWPRDGGQLRVLRSHDFLVQVFQEAEGVIRLTVNRTTMRSDGRWRDGISWDELQSLKSQAGYGDRFAVEVYPEDACVVDVANMRHLWLLPERLPFAWKRGEQT